MQWALDHRNQTRPRVTQERDEKPMSTTHKALAAWVEEVAALTTPDKIHWVTGTPEEIDALAQELVAAGTFKRLNDEKKPNSYYLSLIHISEPTRPY